MSETNIKIHENFSQRWAKFFVVGLMSLSMVAGSVYFQNRMQQPSQTKDVVHFLNLEGLNFAFRESAREFSNIFTFDPKRKSERIKHRVQTLLDDTLSYASRGDFSAAETRLVKIRALATDASSDANFQKYMLTTSTKFLSAPSGHPSVRIANELMFMIFSFPKIPGLEKDYFQLFDYQAKKIFDDLDKEKSVAENLLRLSFLKDYADTLRRNFGENKIKTALSAYGKTMETLITKHDAYLQKSFLEIFLFLDQSRGNSKQTLAFLHSSLQRMKRLLEEEKISFLEGKETMFFLLSHLRTVLEKLPKDDVSALAVHATMKSYESFFAFLFSSEVQTLQGSFQEKFSTFLSREREASAISEIGGAEFSVRKESLAPLEQVKKDFAILQLKNPEFTPSVEEQNKIHIRAVFTDTPFTAIYDVDRKIFTDITIDDESYQQSVSLGKFSAFFLASLGKFVPSDEEVPEALTSSVENPESRIEKVLKAKVVEKFTVLGFSIKEEQVTFLDSAAEYVKIEDLPVVLDSAPGLTLSLEFFNETNEVKNVTFETLLGPVIIPEKFEVAKLAERVRLLYERSKLEKERLETEEIEEP